MRVLKHLRPLDPRGLADERALGDAVRHLTRAAATVLWSLPPLDAPLDPPWERTAPVLLDAAGEPAAPTPKRAFSDDSPIAAAAVKARARVARANGERLLRRLGIRVVRSRLHDSAPPRAAELETDVDSSQAAPGLAMSSNA